MRSVDTSSLSPSLSQIDHKRLKQSIMMNILYRNTGLYILFCGAVHWCSPALQSRPERRVVSGLFHQFYHSGRAGRRGEWRRHYITYSSSFRPLSTTNTVIVNHLSFDGEEEEILSKCLNILSLLCK